MHCNCCSSSLIFALLTAIFTPRIDHIHPTSKKFHMLEKAALKFNNGASKPSLNEPHDAEQATFQNEEAKTTHSITLTYKRKSK